MYKIKKEYLSNITSKCLLMKYTTKVWERNRGEAEYELAPQINETLLFKVSSAYTYSLTSAADFSGKQGKAAIFHGGCKRKC